MDISEHLGYVNWLFWILEGTLLMLIGFLSCKWRTFGGDLVNGIQGGGGAHFGGDPTGINLIPSNSGEIWRAPSGDFNWIIQLGDI